MHNNNIEEISFMIKFDVNMWYYLCVNFVSKPKNLITSWRTKVITTKLFQNEPLIKKLIYFKKIICKILDRKSYSLWFANNYQKYSIISNYYIYFFHFRCSSLYRQTKDQRLTREAMKKYLRERGDMVSTITKKAIW